MKCEVSPLIKIIDQLVGAAEAPVQYFYLWIFPSI